MFKVIKLKNIFLWLIIVFIITILFSFPYVYSFANSPKSKYTIVIDAGHGGIDVNIRHKVF